MDLSSPKLRKILIGLAIFTVVVFIAIKIWRRSYYSYPNTSEDAQVPITAMTQAGSVVTVAAAGHNFKVGDIVIMKGTGLTVTTTSGVMPTVSGITETPVIVATVTPNVSFTFSGSFIGTFTPTGATAEAVGYGVMTSLKGALVECQDAYATEVIAAGTNQGAKDAATAKRTSCIATAVAPYTRGHCQWLPPAPTAGNPNPGLPVPPSGDAQIAYNEYQENIKKIQTAYVQAANRAAAGTFTGLTTAANITKANDIVSAARAADITGATQKYLATVCPGFYQPGDPALPDPSGDYKLWSAVQGATDTVTGTQKHFYSPTTGISDAAILTWAQYGAPVTFTPGTGLTAGTGYLNGVTVSGYSDKSAITTGPNGENWRIAYANGPGTKPLVVPQTPMVQA
jgi:hypothetical protein